MERRSAVERDSGWYVVLNPMQWFGSTNYINYNQALARTIASRPDIILLDDVFSAVDRNTARLIQESLLGRNGILRQMGVTVIQTVQDSQ